MSNNPTSSFVQDRLSTETERDEEIDFLKALGSKAKIVVLDSFASTYGRGFDLLPYVDLYVKKSLFKDFDLYDHHFLDSRIFSNYLIGNGHLRATSTWCIVMSGHGGIVG